MPSIGMINDSVRNRQEKVTGDKIPSGYSKAQINQYTPQQTQLFEDSFSHLGPKSYLSRLASGDQSQFDEMEAPAMRQFQGLQGQLASRFSGMGMGGRKSSGFQNSANQATSDFAQDLQSKRMELRNQAIRDLMGMSNQLLNQRPYEKMLSKKDKGFLHEAGVSAAQGFGQGAGQAAGKWATGGV